MGDGRRDRAPRIEAALRDDLSTRDDPGFLKVMRHNDESERRARCRQGLPLYPSRVRSRRLLCGMCAELPEAAHGSLPPRVGFDSALGNGGTPKLRRLSYAEVAAHRAKASSSSTDASTCDGCRDPAPRIEAAHRDDLSTRDDPGFPKVMRHND